MADCEICEDMTVPIEPAPAEFKVTLTDHAGRPQDQFITCGLHLSETIAGYVNTGALSNADISRI